MPSITERKVLKVIDRNTLIHELTMLYLKSKNLSGFSPEELVKEYNEASRKIKQECDAHNQKWDF